MSNINILENWSKIDVASKQMLIDKKQKQVDKTHASFLRYAGASKYTDKVINRINLLSSKLKELNNELEFMKSN